MSRIDKQNTTYARMFHESLCIDLDITPMTVLVFKSIPKFIKESKSTTGIMFLDDEYIIAFFDYKKDPLDKLLRTVAHETYHAYQIQKGLIERIHDEWCYMGTPLREVNEKRWSKRPHEIEAENYAANVMLTLNIKGISNDQ